MHINLKSIVQIMNLPQSGISKQKANFFREVSLAFEFLEIYYSLPEDKQAELMEYILKLQAERL